MTRAKARPKLDAGRDTFHVLTADGAQLSVKGAAPHALNVAQKCAERSPDEVTLTVRRRSLLGPSVDIYRVVRVEGGAVYTRTLNPDD